MDNQANAPRPSDKEIAFLFQELSNAKKSNEALFESCREALAYDREAMLPSTVEKLEQAIAKAEGR